MGYWDKKEEVYKAKPPVQTKATEKEEYDTIDTKAIEELEKGTMESARNVLKDVEGIADDIARQKRQFSDLLSTGYWCAIVFNNDTQKYQFLLDMGFEPSMTFVDGKEFAKRCGVRIEEPDHDYSERKIQQAYKDRARPIKE